MRRSPADGEEAIECLSTPGICLPGSLLHSSMVPLVNGRDMEKYIPLLSVCLHSLKQLIHHLSPGLFFPLSLTVHCIAEVAVGCLYLRFRLCPIQFSAHHVRVLQPSNGRR